MAKDSIKNVPAAAPAFNLADYLPPGANAADYEKIGGLTPLYVHEMAWENKFPPVAGRIVCIEQLPVDTFDAMCLRIELNKPSQGCVGKAPDFKVADVDAGKDILVPINGSLRNNKDLLRAAMDRTNAWDVVIVLVGQQRVNKKPSDMWVYDVYLDKKHPHPRVGSRFEFRGEDKPLFAKTGDGTIYDMRTGEVVEATPPRALPQQATA